MPYRFQPTPIDIRKTVFKDKKLWIVAIAMAVATWVTRWPLRSRALFSWDSANFALALQRIDIAAHRPHPPGYLGYVFAARALQHVFHDPNTALVAWNILATAAAVAVLTTFAFESAAPDRQTLTAVAVTTLVVTSPVVWFYSEVAEIYASELLFASLVGYAAWRAARGEDRAFYACAILLGITAVFKVVTAALLLPVVLYASSRVSATCRMRSIAIAAIAGLALIGVVLAIQPTLFAFGFQVLRSSDWFLWFFFSDLSNVLEVLNRNARITLIDATATLGLFNAVALAVWAIRDRTLPSGINRTVALLWLAPILLICIGWVIAKPGYLLVVMPLAALVLGGFYARQPVPLAVTLIAAQAIVNVAHFTLLAPPSTAMTGGGARYRDKPLWQKAVSDLQPLTFPTAATIAESDRGVHDVVAFVASSCPGGDGVLVADLRPVDWRRLLWYFPSATAIHQVGGVTDLIGHDTDATGLPPGGLYVNTTCPVLWLAPDEGGGGVAKPDGSLTVVPGVGWTTPAGALRVTREKIEALPR